MAVATSLNRNPGRRLMPEILGHHRGGTAQKGERACQHALVPNRYQLRHAGEVSGSENGDRVAFRRPKQIAMLLAQNLLAQSPAAFVTLCQRAGRCLNHGCFSGPIQLGQRSAHTNNNVALRRSFPGAFHVPGQITSFLNGKRPQRSERCRPHAASGNHVPAYSVQKLPSIQDRYHPRLESLTTREPLRPGHVWLIHAKLQLERRTRDLALFNLAIDSKLRGCDLVALRVDVAPNGYAVHRVNIRQVQCRKRQ